MFRWRRIEWTTVAQWLADMQISYMEEDLTRKYGYLRQMAYREFKHDEHYISSFPIVIALQEVPITMWQMNPQYGPRRPLLRTRMLTLRPDELQDMQHFCMSCVNHGVALRDPGEEPGDGVALPGRFVHSQGRWVWAPYVSSWEETREGALSHGPLAQVLRRQRFSGMWHPEETMRRFNHYRTGGPPGISGLAIVRLFSCFYTCIY